MRVVLSVSVSWSGCLLLVGTRSNTQVSSTWYICMTIKKNKNTKSAKYFQSHKHTYILFITLVLLFDIVFGFVACLFVVSVLCVLCVLGACVYVTAPHQI
jgi:hypothetical protein